MRSVIPKNRSDTAAMSFWRGCKSYLVPLFTLTRLISLLIQFLFDQTSSSRKGQVPLAKSSSTMLSYAGMWALILLMAFLATSFSELAIVRLIEFGVVCLAIHLTGLSEWLRLKVKR